MKENLTDSQKQLLKKMLDPNTEVGRCTSGYAIWDKRINESQGRTSSNRIENEDLEFLLKNRYIKYLEYIDVFMEELREPVRTILIDEFVLTRKGKKTAFVLD